VRRSGSHWSSPKRRGMEVVIPEAGLTEIVVPDLEDTKPEDEDR
jgi:hypothetical protein